MNTKEQFIKNILDSTKYIDKNPGNKKSITASRLGEDSNKIVIEKLVAKNPVDSIRANTLGSILHLGMEQVNLAKDLGNGIFDGNEVSMSMTMSNGWTFSGTADKLLVQERDNVYHVTIADYKFTKKYALKMTKKDGLFHSYSLQSAGLRLLVLNNLSDFKIPSDATIEWHLKDFFFLKDNDEVLGESALEIEDMECLEPNEIEDFILAKTEEVDIIMEKGTEQCADIWLRRKSKKDPTMIPSKCMVYCDVSNECPHYNPTTKQVLSSW